MLNLKTLYQTISFYANKIHVFLYIYYFTIIKSLCYNVLAVNKLPFKQRHKDTGEHMTKDQLIKGCKAPSFHSQHYANLCYADISRHSCHANNELLQNGDLYFIDHVGYQYMSSQELVHYPELTKALRQLDDYPTFSKKYGVDRNLTGMDFINYFFKHLIECEQDFRADIAQRHATVNHLIHLYGHQSTLPRITAINTTQGLSLIISGVTWRIMYHNYHEDNHINCLYIGPIFDLCNSFESFCLSAFIPNSPYLALRLAKSRTHRGRLIWYSLETFKEANVADIKSKKHLIEEI